jgi:pyruvate,orthophosphate dikinase
VTISFRGLGANKGRIEGRFAITPACAERLLEQGLQVILVRPDLGAEDAALLGRVHAVLLFRAGLTGDGAIMARALGKPCVVSVRALFVSGSTLHARDESSMDLARPREFTEGAAMALDGATGVVTLD